MIELPGHTAEQNGTECDDTGTSQKEPIQLLPDVWSDLWFTAAWRVYESINGFLDLSYLYTGVDEHASVVEAESDDLNRILGAQRIVNQDQLVQEAENEEGQVGRDGV